MRSERRRFLTGLGAAASGVSLARPALAQSNPEVRWDRDFEFPAQSRHHLSRRRDSSRRQSPRRPTVDLRCRSRRREKSSKWIKWQIGAASTAAIIVLFSTIQDSTAFKEKVLGGSSNPVEGSTNSPSQPDRLMQDCSDQGMGTAPLAETAAIGDVMEDEADSKAAGPAETLAEALHRTALPAPVAGWIPAMAGATVQAAAGASPTAVAA